MTQNARIGYYGFADTIDKDDERQDEWREQVNTRGFDDTELWSLDCAFVKFIVPRLRVVREGMNETKDPSGVREIEFLIETFQAEIDSEGARNNFESLKKAMEMFARNIFSYWN